MKKFLAIGPGESTIHLSANFKNLKSDIKTIGLHRAFPYLKITHDFDLDYWTWGDPNSTAMGFEWILKNPNKKHPTIIVPYWMSKVSSFLENSGTSPIMYNQSRISSYEKMMDTLHKNGKVIYLKNAISTKGIGNKPDHRIFKEPITRFNSESIYFGSVPFDCRHSDCNWAKENKFTKDILPILHSIGADVIYSIGFDNRGLGINRSIPMAHNNKSIIDGYMQKLKLWVNEWSHLHNMKLYSVAPDNFTRNNEILEYTNLKNILK